MKACVFLMWILWGVGLAVAQEFVPETYPVCSNKLYRLMYTNGVDWFPADLPPSGVITLSHNGQGVLYALVASSIMDDSYCKVSLQSTNDGSTWADHGEVCRMQTEGLYSLQEEISALNSNVMIRVNRGDVILYDASANLFSTISFPGDAIDQLFFSGACMYVITDPYADAAFYSESYDVIPGEWKAWYRGK